MKHALQIEPESGIDIKLVAWPSGDAAVAHLQACHLLSYPSEALLS